MKRFKRYAVLFIPIVLTVAFARCEETTDPAYEANLEEPLHNSTHVTGLNVRHVVSMIPNANGAGLKAQHTTLTRTFETSTDQDVVCFEAWFRPLDVGTWESTGAGYWAAIGAWKPSNTSTWSAVPAGGKIAVQENSSAKEGFSNQRVIALPDEITLESMEAFIHNLTPNYLKRALKKETKYRQRYGETTFSLAVATVAPGLTDNDISDLREVAKERAYGRKKAKQFVLKNNFPEPFNPSTNIPYSILEDRAIPVTLQVFNLNGQVVRTLVNEMQSSGDYAVYWNGKDNFDRSVASGLYLYQLTSGGISQSEKMVLVK